MPIGSSWASGSWTDGAWAEGTWAGGEIVSGGCAFESTAFENTAFNVCVTSEGNYVQRVIGRTTRAEDFARPAVDLEKLLRLKRQQREEEEIIIL